MKTQATAGDGAAVVAIAGGMGALGRALAQRFKQRGDQVVVLDQATDAAGLPQAGADLALLDVDLNDVASTRHAFDTIARRFGRLDALVSVAGGFHHETLAEGKVKAWDHMYALNLRTAVVACQAALPLMLARGAGHVVCIGSDAIGRAHAGLGAYAASKAGVAELVRTLAAETRDQGIAANAVLPGTLDTPGNRRAMPDADFSRWVSLDAAAALILFLASPLAAQINGACIPIVNRC
ncbi:short-chain dehydrogenase [Bordetella pertussis]|uniref:2-(R)-hydroxypropyl-CoM dehydrogenase n=15 Tax=Bordetella TaxID=517 RepID=A0A381A4Z6_BORPT|nr:SDR family oxidoreductase [Bordetella pertussis]ETH38590.1 KR domain protein [Bordetella pertussis H918]ETH42678.1 KR domain protein [Bordetella pertussis H939]ETH45592.1 KR domain protein [Bordetella pertussis H921]ETH69716.1 KR domain protein [Bordetella pertussis STO1-CHLA-0011]ETH83093.1 KR domain protein [Bordetella pertussis STO1-CHOC-0017]ETH92169.1 KR domain protein [Bordetella pertussis STO1-CHOC-0019]ETH98998.1 KR domain protein [Bordetella pertussis STO1-CHOM-0012]KCV17629.1 K